MIEFKALHSKYSQEMAGYIPFYFNEDDPRDTLEQLSEGYASTAGAPPSEFFNKKRVHKMEADGSLKYPGDPVQRPIAKFLFREDVLYQYDCEMSSLVLANGAWFVWRLD